MSHLPNWTYNNLNIYTHSDLLEDCTDIVYLITYSTGQMYIGKKTVRSESTLPIQKKPRENASVITRHILRDENGKIITSKAERKAARAKGLKAKAEVYEQVLTDKPFVKYAGSSELTKELTITSREILYQCSTKRAATYLESKELFTRDALFNSDYLNANIAGTHFDNVLDGLLT